MIEGHWSSQSSIRYTIGLSGNQMVKLLPIVFFSSGFGLTADSSGLTLTLTFLVFGLDFAQSFPFHAQFCHFGLVFCLFDDIHFLHNTNAKQTYIWQFLSVFGHLSSFLELVSLQLLLQFYILSIVFLIIGDIMNFLNSIKESTGCFELPE
ncbi:hypothetical protein Tco_0826516 [Tanacetum coccineum]